MRQRKKKGGDILKKVISIFLCFVLIFCLASCGAEEENQPTSTINDKYYKKQEYIKTHNAAEVIKKYKGKGVKVALIDSGYKTGSSDVDYTKIKEGLNLTNDNGYNDWLPHGWCSCSLLVSKQNNKKGICGMVSGCTVYIYKVFGSDGQGCSSADIADAVNRAVADGVDVINCSFGGPDYSKEEKAAIQNAIAQGVIVVCSAGNDGNSEKIYPADICPEVVKVGACDVFGELCYFSNTGNVDCLAVGEDVFVQTGKSSYDYVSGTSFSAPIITALAVICKSIDKNIDAEGFEKVLKYAGNRKTKSSSKGWGIPDFERAVKKAKNMKKKTNILENSNNVRYYPIGAVE